MILTRKINLVRPMNAPVFRPKRVAAYARVSSGKDAMLHSLAAQVSYYDGLISKEPGWIMAGVYADEALTGTKADRDAFQRLLTDCRAGKVDTILTKSISRFARNTVTLLETVRELKGLGVNVMFEEQNIDTATADGELMLTILASYAQEESLSASENQKWRVRQNFQNGKPWRGYMLGYRYDGQQYIVVPEEAETVRFIFRQFLAGKGVTSIAKRLNEDEVLTQQGNPWSKCAVTRVLKNYAYTGNLLLQTKFRENHLTKRTLVNRGQLPQYHAEATHEPIVDLETYHATQLELAKRAEKYGAAQSTARYPFSGIITCGGCGKHYRRKVTATGPIWICPTYNDYGKQACAAKAIPESILHELAGEFEEVSGIRVEKDNTLIFTLATGEEVLRRWKDRSRSESWTPEMRAAVGAKNRERKAEHVYS